MSNEMKFEYGFTNHAPVVFTLSEIEAGKVREFLYNDVGSVKYRKPIVPEQEHFESGHVIDATGGTG